MPASSFYRRRTYAPELPEGKTVYHSRKIEIIGEDFESRNSLNQDD